MKIKKNKCECEYVVVNAFSDISEAERKEKVNRSIKNLCILDIEKIAELDYNIEDVAFYGSVPDLEKRRNA